MHCETNYGACRGCPSATAVSPGPRPARASFTERRRHAMQAEEEQLATGDSAVNDGDSTRAEVVNELRVEVEGDVPPLAATEAEAAADAMPPTEPTEAEAAGNAVLPTLGKDMTSAELRTYLTEFTTSAGVKIFDTAAVDQLEFYPMETLYSCANSSGKWQNVVDRLFHGDLATAQLFQAKVHAAKVSETKAARHAASKLGKAEKKGRRGWLSCAQETRRGRSRSRRQRRSARSTRRPQ